MRQTYCHLLFNIATLKENHQPCIQDTQKEAKKMQGQSMAPPDWPGQRTSEAVIAFLYCHLYLQSFPVLCTATDGAVSAILSLQHNASTGHAG